MAALEARVMDADADGIQEASLLQWHQRLDRLVSIRSNVWSTIGRRGFD